MTECNHSVGRGSAGEQMSLIIIMYTTYVLKGSNNKLYKGVTNNLTGRLQEHNSGQTKTTANMQKLEIVYTEIYDTFIEARKREVYLKTAAGRRFLKKILDK